ARQSPHFPQQRRAASARFGASVPPGGSPARAPAGPRARFGRALLALLAALGAGSGAFAATLSISVQLSTGRPLGGAVVTVRSDGVPAHPAPPVKAIMDQVDRAFEPDLLVIPV